ncbi:hypothetical protein LC613_21240 [Nostoc sphaeroides CHAB 2801]|uniref:hypothetical protein n=1 Tax=Nostoc sphaeroides TaxID=446679 RepID=UPI000E5034E6|nr:hypothetical protein [Nostoc sphaeroides]MCC5630395.1 hypothetical protein [Nostoc sphaeroides CHAB 2801]
MIVLSESTEQIEPSASASENKLMAEAAQLLGFPVFVKGAVQSIKMQGWKSCVANNLEELVRLTEWLLKLKDRSRGRVIKYCLLLALLYEKLLFADSANI